MTLKNRIRFEPPVRELKEEGDIILLLNEVGRDLHITDIRKTIDIVEKGEYEVALEGNVHVVADLRVAKRLLEQYKIKSSRTCRGCFNREVIQGKGEFCVEHEDAENAYFDRSWIISPRVAEYSDRKDCSDYRPIFRPLEEVLKDAGLTKAQ